MLSCYDAELSYDSRTDAFTARYPPHGRRTMVVEEGVPWERLRASPVETSAHELHLSDCLADLRPGDHVEIQWRRNKEFPYGRSSLPAALSMRIEAGLSQKSPPESSIFLPEVLMASRRLWQAGGTASWVTWVPAAGTSSIVAVTAVVSCYSFDGRNPFPFFSP